MFSTRCGHPATRKILVCWEAFEKSSETGEGTGKQDIRGTAAGTGAAESEEEAEGRLHRSQQPLEWEVTARWVLVSFLRQHVKGDEEIASSCARIGLDWVS